MTEFQQPLIRRALEPITFTVYGDPHPNRAPQFKIIGPKRSDRGPKCPHCRRTILVMTYPEPEVRMAKEDFTKQSLPFRPPHPWSGAIRLDITFFVRIPLSFTTAERAAAVSGALLPTKRPDRDNLLKLAQDAMNGVFWKDDSIICAGDVQKRYGLEPRTEVRISQIVEGED